MIECCAECCVHSSFNWDAIAAIAQIFAAVATSAAVIVTLWLNHKANQKKLKLRFQENLEEYKGWNFGGKDDEATTIFSGIQVSNEGQRVIEIDDWGFLTDSNALYWFDRGNDHTVKKVQKVVLPQVVSPNGSFRLFYPYNRLCKAVAECNEQGDFHRTDKPLTLFVEDASGERFTVNTNQTIDFYLKEAAKKSEVKPDAQT
mgnify:CR=1 FL=1